MIIVNQDKEKIKEFNNIITLSYDNIYEEIWIINIDGEDMGHYKTKERAKEVLQEIINKYGKYDIDDCNAVTVFPKVYEMPKE